MSDTKFDTKPLNTGTACEAISNSILKIRNGLRSNAGASELMNLFWVVQDNLGRLVDAASDYPSVTFDLIREFYPRLLQDIIGVLAAAAKKDVIRNMALYASCAAINELLMKLERLKFSAECAGMNPCS